MVPAKHNEKAAEDIFGHRQVEKAASKGHEARRTSASDSLGSPVRYTDGSTSREYEEQPVSPSEMRYNADAQLLYEKPTFRTSRRRYL